MLNGTYSNNKFEYNTQFDRMMEETYLARLLNGEYGSEEEALKTPDRCKFQLNASHYLALSLSVIDFSSDWLDSSIDSFASMRNTIVPEIQHEFFGFLEGIYENYYCVLDRAVTIVVCLQPEDLVAGKGDAFIKVRQSSSVCMDRLKNKGIYVTAMVSDICESVLGIQKAYMQIKELREYKKILGIEDDFLIYAALDRPKDQITIQRRELEYTLDYLNAIQRADYESARAALKVFSGDMFLDHHTIPANVVTNYQYFLHVLFLSIEEIKKHTDEQLNDLMMPEKLFLSTMSIPEILQNMDRLLRQLTKQLGNTDGDSVHYPAWYWALMRYIDENYTDVTLNVSSLAERFSMNSTFLSSTFKNYTDMRLLDYINQKRVSYAKKCILNGNTVNQAAKESGFGSVLTMRRSFVKFEGTLPSRL